MTQLISKAAGQLPLGCQLTERLRPCRRMILHAIAILTAGLVALAGMMAPAQARLSDAALAERIEMLNKRLDVDSSPFLEEAMTDPVLKEIVREKLGDNDTFAEAMSNDGALEAFLADFEQAMVAGMRSEVIADGDPSLNELSTDGTIPLDVLLSKWQEQAAEGKQLADETYRKISILLSNLQLLKQFHQDNPSVDLTQHPALIEWYLSIIPSVPPISGNTGS